MNNIQKNELMLDHLRLYLDGNDDMCIEDGRMVTTISRYSTPELYRWMKANGLHEEEEEDVEPEEKFQFTLDFIMNNGNDWDEFCQETGVSVWAVAEGGGSSTVSLTTTQVKKFGLFKD